MDGWCNEVAMGDVSSEVSGSSLATVTKSVEGLQ